LDGCSGKASKTFPAPSEKQPAGRGIPSAFSQQNAEAANFTTFSACLIENGVMVVLWAAHPADGEILHVCGV